MLKLNDLLEKFKNLLLAEESKRAMIVNIIYEVTNIKINPRDIKIKDNIIYLNIKPIYKNEIFFKKNQIIKKLQENINFKNLDIL